MIKQIYKYLKLTFETNAVRNSNYVVVPRADKIILEIFTTKPIEIEIQNGNMGIILTTYHERLPITSGQNIITLDEATKVSIHIDSELILKNDIPDNAILQVAPQTTIKNIAQGASVEHLLQAIILDNGNIPNIHSEIIARDNVSTTTHYS